MEATDCRRPLHRGRHRGKHRDPWGTALAAAWGLGHVATLTLLGITAQHQLATDHQSATPPARTLPDWPSDG